jgi:putative ABC transport system ATP-binding protein
MSPVLEARSLGKTYLDGAEERRVLHDLSLDAGAGEVVAVVGPSGSGKSTLLNLLAGILAVDSGRIRLTLSGCTVDLDRATEAERTRIRRRHIGYVFQFFNLVPTLTVRENVLFPLELNGMSDLREEALARLLGLGLADRLDDFPDHLSGGERQRTAIARALAHRPRLVLADEPTGNLDADNAERVVSLLTSETRALGSALVMATHSESIAARADRILPLGKVENSHR